MHTVVDRSTTAVNIMPMSFVACRKVRDYLPCKCFRADNETLLVSKPGDQMHGAAGWG